MIRERVPTIVLVNSPQNSKDKSLVKTDLLEDPVFRGVVRRFDRASGIGDNESLAEERQGASVVMSVATHTTFAERLRMKIPNSRVNFRYVGHSVGETASFIEAGVMDIETAAWLMDRRQEITEKPVESAVRFMVACVGVDMKQLEEGFGKISEAFGDTVKAVLANRNTPWQGVLSMEIPLGQEPRAVTKRLSELFAEFKQPGIDKPPGFIHLRAIKNAFHSSMLGPEELLLQYMMDQKIDETNFRNPEPGIIYSPMYRGWITDRKQALHVVRHQLTSEVFFSEGVAGILQLPDLALFVTSDIKEEVSPKIVRENVDGRVPVININNQASMKRAVEVTSEMIEQSPERAWL